MLLFLILCTLHDSKESHPLQQSSTVELFQCLKENRDLICLKRLFGSLIVKDDDFIAAFLQRT